MIRVENTVEEGENAGYQHFLLFPECFPNPSSLESLEVTILWERVNPFQDGKLSVFSKVKVFAGDKNK